MSDGESERLRVPQPVIKKRIASGRGAMEQPNVTGDGAAALTPTFWLAVVATGVLTGLIGDALMALLYQAERMAFAYHGGDFTNAVAATSPLRRVVMLVVAGVLGSCSWYFIRKYLRHERSEIDDAVWRHDGELGFRRSALTSIVSEIVIGFGASIGREAAPKLMGGASGSVLAHWLKLTTAQQRLLVACGGGAGLACVYNVPLGGAIFTAEVLLGSFALPTVLPALLCSAVATGTAYLTLPTRPTYVDLGTFHSSVSLTAWSVVAGILIGLLAVGYTRSIGWASHWRASGTQVLWVMPLAFGFVGVLGIAYPALFGNGKDMAHSAFLGVGSLGVLTMWWLLKPFTTTLTLASGAAGGVFTPFLATGAVFGGLLGGLWVHVWPGTPLGAFALIGAAAMIGATMQAPLAGLVLVLELTHSGFTLAIPLMLATLIATSLSRHIDGYSIYSARLARE